MKLFKGCLEFQGYKKDFKNPFISRVLDNAQIYRIVKGRNYKVYL